MAGVCTSHFFLMSLNFEYGLLIFSFLCFMSKLFPKIVINFSILLLVLFSNKDFAQTLNLKDFEKMNSV